MTWKFTKVSFINLFYPAYLDFFVETLEILNTKQKNYNFHISSHPFPPIIK